MRAFLVISALLVAALAGCTSAKLPTSGLPDATLVTPAALPAPIHDSQSVMGQADVQNLAQQPICTSPAAKCFHYAFTSNTTANATATLTWTQVGDDFDLYLYQDGTLVSNDGINEAGSSNPNDYTTTTQVMHVAIEAGTYEFIVVPFLVTEDTFTFDAQFAA